MVSSKPHNDDQSLDSDRAAQRGPAGEPGRSEGMPAKTASPGRSRPDQSVKPKDASDESNLALPHERDQSIDMTDAQPDPQVQQAARDLKRNLQDTDKSAAMDRAYQKLKSPGR